MAGGAYVLVQPVCQLNSRDMIGDKLKGDGASEELRTYSIPDFELYGCLVI